MFHHEDAMFFRRVPQVLDQARQPIEVRFSERPVPVEDEGHVAFVFYRDGTFGESDFDGLASLIEDLRNASEEHGVFVVEHAPAALKERVGVWGSTRGNRPIMEMLKKRFDPKGTLNPGRFVDGI